MLSCVCCYDDPSKLGFSKYIKKKLKTARCAVCLLSTTVMNGKIEIFARKEYMCGGLPES